MGNIASWHRKHIAYGVPKTITQPGLKESYGTLLYYIAKLAQLSEMEGVIENRFEKLEVKGAENIDIIGAIGAMSEVGTTLVQCSFHSEPWIEDLCKILDLLIVLIAHEGWELEDVQYSSLAKADVEAATV